MDRPQDMDRFRNLRFEDFGRMASDKTLKPHERIGFPSAFREGYDPLILDDLKKKIPQLNLTGKTIIDLGCGCGELTYLLIESCRQNKHELVLIDSDEVLAQLPDAPHIKKVPGRFPQNYQSILSVIESADAIICYSVFHYVFVEGHSFEFIEKALSLLIPGGVFLLGDIPNATRRNRFLYTPQGQAFHHKLMNTNDKPDVSPFEMEEGKMDDGFIFGLLMRYRNFGMETYLLPQPVELPLSNSREDILFVKY